MAKMYPAKPFLLMLYGYPGAGKTYFARQLAETVQVAHLQADRIRGELFEEPRYDKQENDVVFQLMDYMAEEFLNAGLSVVYDTTAMRYGQRQYLRNLALKCHAQPVLLWFQLDPETAFTRIVKRDRRRADDKYAVKLDRTSFEQILGNMQNPRSNESYAVVSGKHLFDMQKSSFLGALRQMGIFSSDDTAGHIVKPGMVNLVPNQGRVDMGRRNISIRQ